MKIKSIQKNYLKTTKYIIYGKEFEAKGAKSCRKHNKINCTYCSPRGSKLFASKCSILRSQTLIRDYALSNAFDLFITFTINPEKTNPKDYKLAKKRMTHWLNYQKKCYPDLFYLIVPELHKSGSIHYHGLFGNYYGSLYETKLKSKSGKKIYNLLDYKWGFTTATIISNPFKTANYITKYVTKDLISSMGNKKRYWVSKNLTLPKKLYNIDENSLNFDEQINLSTYKTEYYTIYNILK